MIRELAAVRYGLRKFLRFSERAAKRYGVTPQQHQLLLGVAGFNGTGKATVSELAEFLQERHHAVGELASRCVMRGLVRKSRSDDDHRVVLVTLTPNGRAILKKISRLNKPQADLLRNALLQMEVNQLKRRAYIRIETK
jgi:DNA-binding MarR family transcriptional regulator